MGAGKRNVKEEEEEEEEEEYKFEIQNESEEDEATDAPDSEESEQEGLLNLEDKRLRVIRKIRTVTEIAPDYNSDSSDEDTLGNIPIHWYDDYDHLGYDLSGKRIPKPANEDLIDDFIGKQNYILDKYNNKVFLSREELLLINKIGQREFVGINPYEDQVEYFSGLTEIMPLQGGHEPKNRFVPSKLEARKIMHLARRLQRFGPNVKKDLSESKLPYDIWQGDSQITRDKIQAPKISLPQNNESYNPPEEYILSKQEEQEWLEMDPEDRPHNFLPKKHSSLREVKGYSRFLQERFERCLDLYLCPRTIKQKLDIDPESLIPKLPSPKDLKPFPTKLSIIYKGHVGRVRSFSISPNGQFICSGGDDKTVKIWEVSSGRLLKSFGFENTVMNVQWNPNEDISIIAVACDSKIILLDPDVENDEISQETGELIKQGNQSEPTEVAEWKTSTEQGHLLEIELNQVLYY
jgi:ribosome biogenesis protein ERB1